jgi:predicted DsbA family dithiol-disulfide isomerase
MNVKILGVGCSVCQRMYSTVTQIIARENMEAEVEYIPDIEKILSYGVLSTPALVINEKVVMIGYRGARKIEQALRESDQV